MKKRLLIVENRHEFYRKFADSLGEKHKIYFVDKFHQARNILRNGKYDGVLTEVYLGYLFPKAGIEIASLAVSKEIPVLVMSTRNHREEAQRAGAKGFLFKKEIISMLKKGRNLSCLFINNHKR